MSTERPQQQPWRRCYRLFGLVIDDVSLSAKAAFLRAVGLWMLLLAPFRGEEETKPLITHSRRMALARCGVHIFPAAVSITILYFNIPGYYIGTELEGQQNLDNVKFGLLQVCAKAQIQQGQLCSALNVAQLTKKPELLIVASVTSIVVHFIRYQLVSGAGMPFGLLSSGFTFSNISFFWSPDFVGNITRSSLQTNLAVFQHVFFIGLLAICGLIAILAGPASATLMIPRQTDWPVGGVVFWLNGTKDQLWPKYLTKDTLAGHTCDSQDTRLYDPRCPSAGFPALYQHFLAWRGSDTTGRGIEFQLEDLNLRKLMYATFVSRESDAWAWTAHGPSASAHHAAADIHRSFLSEMIRDDEIPAPLSHNIVWANQRAFVVSTNIPAVRVQCAPDITTFTRGHELEIPFQSLPEYSFVNGGNSTSRTVTFNVTDALAAKLDNLDAHQKWSKITPNDIFAQPFVLPSEFDASSIGLIIITIENITTSQGNARGCNIDARWASAESIISDTKGRFSYDYQTDQGAAIIETKLVDDTFRGDLGYFHPPNDGTWQRIKLDPTWFELLAPQVNTSIAIDPLHEKTALTSRTTLETLLMFFNPTAPISGMNKPNRGNGPDNAVLENVIAATVADGISRTGSPINLNYGKLMGHLRPIGTPSRKQKTQVVRYGDPEQSFEMPEALAGENTTQLVMRVHFKGYAMMISGWFDVLCAAVLLTHILLAVGHTFWVISRGDTSEAWDTVTELVALAQVSEPNEGGPLANTSAGIRKLKTMRQVAWVEALPVDIDGVQVIPTDVGFRGEQLRLRVAGTLDRTIGSEVVKEVRYGRV